MQQEAATLLGMLKATTALDPTRNPKIRKKRRNLVLSRMVANSDFGLHFSPDELKTVSTLIANGKLSQEEYEKKRQACQCTQIHGADGTEALVLISENTFVLP